MRLRVLPGTEGSQVSRVLSEVRIEALNTRGTTTDPDTLLMRYLGWARTGADRLASLIAPEEIRRLVLTQTYWTLLTASTSRGAIYQTVQAELDSRAASLEQAIAVLSAEQERWSFGFGPLIVLDTGIFIEHRLEFPDCLEAIADEVTRQDEASRFAEGSPIQFVLPLQVVDELDKTKADRARGRARIALARLNELIESPTAAVQLTNLRTGSALHLLLDDPGHDRLAVPDDEIVDRAVYLKSMGGHTGVATLDTGMDLRARFAGLRSFLLTDRRG